MHYYQLLAINPNFFRFTSEKTVEINVLHDLASCLEYQGFRVTILAPTQPEEEDLGFDELFADLPSGRTLALQFKRPQERNNDSAQFTIDSEQLDTLRDNFRSIDQAFYVFTPFPTNQEFIVNRQILLNRTSIVEIHDINLRMDHRNTRTIIVNKTDPFNASIITTRNHTSPLFGIAAIFLCPFFGGGFFGNPKERKFDKEYYKKFDKEYYKKFDKKKKKEKFKPSGLYLTHITTEIS